MLSRPISETDLCQLCLESFQGFREIAKESRFHLQVDEPIPRRVINNLLSNAIKFSPPDAKVILNLEPL